MADNTNIQLGTLDFLSIKESLIDYLKTQDTLKDYNYAGSAIQVLLDVLAYNTMYYGRYSNMIANEMFLDSAQRVESVISLVKPLGYVVPGRTSSTSRVKVRHGDNAIIPKYTKFSGYKESGTPYTFYSVNDAAIDNMENEVIINIYEAASLVLMSPLLVDVSNQKSFLYGLDIDISTITVEVLNLETDEWDTWTKVDNIHSGLDENSKVYWLERSELGFFVVFGGNVGSESLGPIQPANPDASIGVTQIGKQITDNDSVRISYLRSSGRAGNDVGSWSIHGFPDAEVESLSDGTGLSSGGTDEPNLDMIKFFAPKWFAAQDRAVTAEDCKALLAANGFVGTASNPYEKFNVWGGEEENPPMYGRVFVSVNEEQSEDLIGAATNAMNILKDKTCVTILPEFKSPEYVVAVIGGDIPFEGLATNQSSSTIMNKLISNLTTKYSKSFNKSFSIFKISEDINKVDDSLSCSSYDLNFNIDVKTIMGHDESIRPIFLNSKLSHSSFTTSEFTVGSRYDNDNSIPSNLRLKIRIDQWIDSKTLSLEGWYIKDNGLLSIIKSVGTFKPEIGEIIIHKGVSSEPFTCRVSPLSSTFDATRNIVSEIDVSELNLIGA
jgi:hypothetical protein